jgi:hypothetical protein
MPRIKRSPQAKQDLRSHVLYLAKINPDLAARFIDAAEITDSNNRTLVLHVFYIKQNRDLLKIPSARSRLLIYMKHSNTECLNNKQAVS